MAVVFLVFGTLPAIHPSLRWITYFAAFFVLLSFAISTWFVLTRRPEVGAVTSAIVDPKEVLVWFIVPLVLGGVLLHAMRYGVSATVGTGISRRDLIIASSVMMVPLIAFISLGLVSAISRRPHDYLTVWLARLLSHHAVMFLLFTVAGSISAWGLGLFLGLALTLVVLFHVIMWPAIRFVLMKMLYAAQRHKLITAKLSLWSAGCSLFACAAVPGGLWKMTTFLISKMR